MIETFHNREFEIFEYPDDDYPATKYYYYRVYDDSEQGYIESDGNMFEGAQEARFAAVGHILQLIEKEFPK